MMTFLFARMHPGNNLKGKIVTNIEAHVVSEDEINELAFKAGEIVDDAEFLLERFAFDESYNIIDKLNPTGPKYSYCRLEEDPAEDQRCLREVVLWRRLDDLVDDLILNLKPERRNYHGSELDPRRDAQRLGYALYELICASALNTLDPTIAVQNRFNGNLRGQKKYLQEVTSLWLFRDDVERLLRDLYGDVESDALDRVLGAVFVVVREFTYHVRRDVFREHQNTQDWDYILGAGVLPGGSIGSGDFRTASAALGELLVRVHEVRKNPAAFSKYTVEFATRRVEDFIKLDAEGTRTENSEIITNLLLATQAVGVSVEIEESEDGTEVFLR
jgi:hypothetical protein